MSEPYTTSSSPGKISRSGDTIEFPMLLAADPVEDDQAATKQYVDNNTAPPGESGRIPTIPTRWYLPTGYEKIVASTCAPDIIQVAPLYVSREATWSGISSVITATVLPYGDMRMALYELNPDTLHPETLMWESGDITLLVGGVVYTEVIDVTTTARWLGLGVTHFNTTKSHSYNSGTIKGQYNLFGLHSSRFGFGYGYNHWRMNRAGSHPPEPSVAAFYQVGGHLNINQPRMYLQLGSVP